jgi:ParB family chromosome partitioning protein
VSVDSIIPNRYQPRTVFDEAALEELTESVKRHGVLQPIVVRSLSDEQYELIAGERRWRAAQRAGLKRVPVVVKAAGNQDSLEIALVENLQRENIGPLESAKAYRQLIGEFGLTQEQVAEKVGKSRTAVANTLRLLKLPEKALLALEANSITEGHARALLGFDSPAQQLAVLDRILTENLTVRDVEAGAKPRTSGPKHPVSPTPKLDPDWQALEDRLSEHLAAPVKLVRDARGRGKVTIDFYNSDDLERVLGLLGLTS